VWPSFTSLDLSFYHLPFFFSLLKAFPSLLFHGPTFSLSMIPRRVTIPISIKTPRSVALNFLNFLFPFFVFSRMTLSMDPFPALSDPSAPRKIPAWRKTPPVFRPPPIHPPPIPLHAPPPTREASSSRRGIPSLTDKFADVYLLVSPLYI